MNKKQKHLFGARATLMLFLALLCSIGARATGGTPAGTGTSSDPYVIADADDWATFVSWINNSNSTYADKCYKLGADITISSMAGTSSNMFKGTFDGFGRTITLNDLSSSGEFCAPFRYVDGATFKRIHTTGTVKAGSNTTNDKYRTGLVGESKGNTTITNCWSSVAITTQINGDGTHGGFVGVVNGGTLTITDCLFDGSITGENTYANGGFVGWTGNNTSTITNCLMAGTISANTENGATFMRGSDKNSVVNTADNIKVNNSYYVTSYGTVQGTAVGDLTNAQLLTALGNNWEISGDKLVPVMSTKSLVFATISGLASPYYAWTGSPISLNITVTDVEGNILTENTDYTITTSPSIVQEVGDYTFTINGKGTYIGSTSGTFRVRKDLAGNGTSANPYLIVDRYDWENFVEKVNGGETTACAKLSADITTPITEMIGTSDKKYQGVFDGNGHTLTLGLTTNEDYCAPFRYTDGAIIKRLRLTGNIETSAKYAASIVASASNTFILNCWSSVNINSTYNGWAYHGGIVASCPNLLTLIDHTLFDGSMTGSGSKSCAGFSSNSSVIIRRCLVEPTSFTMDPGTAGIFVYGWTADGSEKYYYRNVNTSNFNYTSGNNASSYTNEKLAEYLGEGWSVSGEKVVPDLTAIYLSTSGRYINTAGKEATWSISDDYKTLTFAGTGDIANYSSEYNRPTFIYKGRVTNVVIPEGITSVGNVCYGYKKLTTVNIPSTLTNIGDYAFYSCNALTSITIPATVTTIGNYAFYGCETLDVTLGHTTTAPEINTYSFQNVTGTLNVQNTSIFNQVSDVWGYATWTVNCLNPSVDFAEAIITGINSVKATGEPIEVSPKVFISGKEVEAANYDLSYTLNGNPVTTIQAEGTYTVTATAKGSYTGTTSTTFAVLPASITYLDENGAEQTCEDYTILTSDMTSIGSYNNNKPTWYVAAADLTFENRISTSYNPNLILLNGATINATKGIYHNGNTLTIYAQSTDASVMGHLIAKGTKGNVAIGGNSDSYSGTIVINGGKIDATGSSVGTTSAAIGVQYYYGTSNITINGGIVTATSGNPNGDTYAIRATGSNASSGSITINGGQVTAVGKYGIGGKSTTPINLGWKNTTDFIQADRYMGTVTLQKAFLLSDGTTIATANTIAGEKLTPVPNVNDLKYAIVTAASVYDYNNNEAVVVEPVVKSAEGVTLEKDTHYTLTYKNSNNATVAAADLKAKGSYTLTITAIAPYTGTRTLAFRIGNGEDLNGYTFSYAEDADGKYYEIGSEADLEQLAAYVNSGHEATGLRFKQTTDITMTDNHQSIGCYDGNNYHYFKGTFDGNDKTITGLTINKANDGYQGLFGMISSAVIKNVTLIDANITGKSNAGGVVGYVTGSSNSKSSIDNCKVLNGTIAATASSSYHGGIAGYAYSTDINNCVVSGTISTAISSDYYGGIIGYIGSNSTITNCESAASIVGEGKYHGGILGYESNSSNFSVSGCLNTGTVEGSSNVGGIAGYLYYTSNYTKNYYGYPCAVKALNGYDYNGQGEHVYGISKGNNISAISSENAVITSKLNGKLYFKSGDAALTLTANIPDGYSFVKYASAEANVGNANVIDGEHALTVGNSDITISALVSSNNATDLSTVTIDDIPDQRWKGNVITPALNVTLGSTPLVLGTDYFVEWNDNAVPGKATLTLTGINNYMGSVVKKFNIVDFALLDPTKSNSSSNPYLVATEEDLKILASIVNTGSRNNGYYKQTANITLTEEHTAIGKNNNRFKGTFDGDKKSISNLTINMPDANYQGLFGYTEGAYVRNVVIDNCDITAKEYVGGVIGYGYDTNVDNCHVSGAIKTATDVTGSYHGGIIGRSNWYNTTNCFNAASVTGNGSYYGGIVGYQSYNSITNCTNVGVVEGTSYVGSIAGSIDSNVTLSNNHHLPNTTGGIGSYDSSVGTDRDGADQLFTIATGVNTQITATPYVWENTDYYYNGMELTLSYELPDGKFFDQFTVSNGTITNPFVIDGVHKLSGVTEGAITLTGSHTDKMSLASEAVTITMGTVPFTGSAITIAPIVKRLDATLVQGTDYTFTTDPAVVQAAGEYTLTVTGKGNYTGSKQATFFVKEATLIHNAEDWATIATNINAGTGCDGYYKLADDFDNTTAVTTTIGTETNPFTGIFDGNGKTLNVDINETSTQGTAPFRQIASATIKDLTVSGNVTGTTHAAGLVGFTKSGINNIDNCVVNVNVTNPNGSGNRHIGGVIGHGVQATNNISNTVYSGVMTNSNHYAGGLLGWTDGGKLNITNCLVTASKSGNGKFHPIAVKNNTAEIEVTVNGAFYTNDATLTDAGYIAATGTKVYAGAQTEFCKKEYTVGEDNYYSKGTAVIGNVGNTIGYTGTTITLAPTVTFEGTALTATTDFIFATDPATVQELGEYTLTITGQGNYAGTQTMKFHVLADVLNGEGTEASPYIIASAEDWGKFAGNINTGAYNYSGQFIKMTDNITVSTMAGNSETNSFQGTFLGTAGKTMTLSLSATTEGCAPFAYLKNATVKDLTVAGTVTTSSKFAASIAAHTYGTTHIQNCVSTAEITSTFETSDDGTHGGFVALNESGAKLYFNNCVFKGKMLGANAHSNGGFVGWANGNVYYTDCLFAPAEITMRPSSSCTFNRNGNNSLTRAYYLTAFGSTQGTIAYTSENVPTEGLFGQITATDGNTYYVQGSVSNINDSYAYTEAVININPSYSISNESVSFVKGTDFEVTITKDGNPVAEVLEVGDYVFTITAKDGGKCKGSVTKNVNIYAAVPSDFKWSNVTASTATLTWTGNAANWTVEISQSSDFSTIFESKNVTDKTVTFEGLMPETDYYARVQSVYGEVHSNWSTICVIQPSNKLTVGSGTSTSGTLPFYNWYHYNMTQQIYTPAELSNQAGTILSLDFYRTDNNSCNNTIEIYLVKTTKENFESATDWIQVTAADKVYSGKALFESNKWSTITLDTPFEYDGTSNLALIVYDPKVSGDSYGSGRTFRVFSGASNQSIQFNNDGTDPTITPSVAGGRSSNKNQIRLGMQLTLSENADNSTTIAENDGKGYYKVKLDGRTLKKDKWNTLCLPFNVDLSADGPLKNATVRTLSNYSNDGTTVTVTYGDDATILEAGKPYIVMLSDETTDDIVNPVFTSAVIDKTVNNVTVGDATFTGTYKPTILDAGDNKKLFVQNNALYYPQSEATVNAMRAYFNLTTAVPTGAGARFIIDFGDGTTSIEDMKAGKESGDWYTVDGRKLAKKPTTKGVYVNGGRKVLIP